MKVAVCAYGLLRSFDKTSESLKKHILEKNNADLFVFAPNKAGTVFIPKGEDINSYKRDNKDLFLNKDSEGELVTEARLKEVYGDYLKKSYLYDSNSIQHDIDTSRVAMNDILIPSRVLSLFYNLSGAAKLALESGNEYDAIILLRTDLAFYSELDVTKLDLNYLHIPFGGGALNDGKAQVPCYYVGYYKNMELGELIQANRHVFTDQLLVADKSQIQVLANLYSNISEYLSRGVPFHPETILFYALSYCQQRNVVIHEEWLYEIVRDNTLLIENDDIIFKNSMLYATEHSGSDHLTVKKILKRIYYKVKMKIKSFVKRLIQ